MKVLLKTAFSILDGRLSTKMDDIYEMLNFVTGSNLLTHQLPTAMKQLKDMNPQWFKDGVDIIDTIKITNQTNDFTELMEIIDKDFSTFEIELEVL